jgi:hypothetical protein
MITNQYTRFIVGKLNAMEAAEVAAQAVRDQAARTLAAQNDYTEAQLLELLTLAQAEDAYETCWVAADQLARHFDYITIYNNCRPLTAVPRSTFDDVPAEVKWITRCTCDGGECSYCTCCELWNGEHSCEWNSAESKQYRGY